MVLGQYIRECTSWSFNNSCQLGVQICILRRYGTALQKIWLQAWPLRNSYANLQVTGVIGGHAKLSNIFYSQPPPPRKEYFCNQGDFHELIIPVSKHFLLNGPPWSQSWRLKHVQLARLCFVWY